MKVNVMSDILKANDLLAVDLKTMLGRKGIVAWNVMGSPGSGKTSVLERLIPMLRGKAKVAVVEGDLSTSRDAQRIAKTGAQAVQINTKGGCHLDAAMVRSAVEKIDLDGLKVLFIENVGNLVCPSEFNLGESGRIIVSSVTEGDDKPEKYPPMFRNGDLVLVNKMDLVKLTNFSFDSFKRGVRKANSRATVIPVSATDGTGFPELLDWIAAKLPT
jgi:hydrogenase nickel incorporation protein HypB